MESKGDWIFWGIIFFTVFIIIGLYMSEDTPLRLKMKDKILDMNNTIENFTSDSTSSDISEGASPKYNWGLPDDYTPYEEQYTKKCDVCPTCPKCHKCPKCDDCKCKKDTL